MNSSLSKLKLFCLLKDGDTPAHIAVSYGHMELLAVLILAGANLNEKNLVLSR